MQRLLIVLRTVLGLDESNKNVSVVVSSIVFNILFCDAVVMVETSHIIINLALPTAARVERCRNSWVSAT